MLSFIKKALLISCCCAFAHAQQSTPGHTALNAKGQITLDSKPIFPIGFGSQWNYSKAQMDYEIDQLASIGATFIQGEANNKSDAEMTQILDHMATHGIRWDLKHFRGSTRTDMSLVNMFKSHTALLGWQIGDDMLIQYPNPADIDPVYDAVKTADPNHLRIISCGLMEPPDYVAHGDVNFYQEYPVDQDPNAEGAGFQWVLKNFRWYGVDACKSITPKKACIGVIQTFSYSFSRMPTAKEIDNMTWATVVSGVDGIQFYTFEQGGSTLNQASPDQWNKVKQLTAEMSNLAPAILNGAFTRKNYAEGDYITWSFWKYNNAYYVIALNTAADSRAFDIAMPNDASGPLTNQFPARALNLSLAGGHLTGSIPALGVNICRLGTPGTAIGDSGPVRRDAKTLMQSIEDASQVFTMEGRRIRSAVSHQPSAVRGVVVVRSGKAITVQVRPLPH
jgi:hypothetical protein